MSLKLINRAPVVISSYITVLTFEMPDTFNLEDEVQKKELRKILLSVINSLGEPDSTIIIHRFYLGESAKDIAFVTNLSEDNVRKRLSRALRKIEKELKGANYEV